nr:hypothetical protein [Tanacetum cinerariifolium]
MPHGRCLALPVQGRRRRTDERAQCAGAPEVQPHQRYASHTTAAALSRSNRVSRPSWPRH